MPVLSYVFKQPLSSKDPSSPTTTSSSSLIKMLFTKIACMAVCLSAVVLSAPAPEPTDIFIPALTLGLPAISLPAISITSGAIASALAAKGLIIAGFAKGAALAQLLNGGQDESNYGYAQSNYYNYQH